MVNANRQRRIRELVTEMNHEYQERTVEHWVNQLPSQYRNRSIQEDLVERRWEQRISRAGVIDLRRYLLNPTKFLLLHGNKGLGKSSLAATLGTELIKTQGYHGGQYRSLPTLLQEFSFPGDGDPINSTSKAPVLVLDDVGASSEQISPHQKKSLWAVIDNRWREDSLVTIMTTNMSITSSSKGQGLIDWFGESSWDRIQHELTRIEFSGNSFRETAADFDGIKYPHSEM